MKQGTEVRARRTIRTGVKGSGKVAVGIGEKGYLTEDCPDTAATVAVRFENGKHIRVARSEVVVYNRIPTFRDERSRDGAGLPEKLEAA